VEEWKVEFLIEKEICIEVKLNLKIRREIRNGFLG